MSEEDTPVTFQRFALLYPSYSVHRLYDIVKQLSPRKTKTGTRKGKYQYLASAFPKLGSRRYIIPALFFSLMKEYSQSD